MTVACYLQILQRIQSCKCAIGDGGNDVVVQIPNKVTILILQVIHKHTCIITQKLVSVKRFAHWHNEFRIAEILLVCHLILNVHVNTSENFNLCSARYAIIRFKNPTWYNFQYIKSL